MWVSGSAIARQIYRIVKAADFRIVSNMRPGFQLYSVYVYLSPCSLSIHVPLILRVLFVCQS